MKTMFKSLILIVFGVMLIVFVVSCGKKENEKPAEKEGYKEYTIKTKPDEQNENEEVETKEETTGQKFDQKLQEAIEHAEKGGVNPNFAVDAILTGNYNDDMISKLEGMGVDVVYGDKNTLRIVVSPKVLKEIENVDFIKSFVLITENYYPNR